MAERSNRRLTSKETSAIKNSDEILPPPPLNIDGSRVSTKRRGDHSVISYPREHRERRKGSPFRAEAQVLAKREMFGADAASEIRRLRLDSIRIRRERSLASCCSLTETSNVPADAQFSSNELSLDSSDSCARSLAQSRRRDIAGQSRRHKSRHASRRDVSLFSHIVSIWRPGAEDNSHPVGVKASTKRRANRGASSLEVYSRKTSRG